MQKNIFLFILILFFCLNITQIMATEKSDSKKENIEISVDLSAQIKQNENSVSEDSEENKQISKIKLIKGLISTIDPKSFVKAFSWRIIGTLITGVVTYILLKMQSLL